MPACGLEPAQATMQQEAVMDAADTAAQQKTKFLRMRVGHVVRFEAGPNGCPEWTIIELQVGCTAFWRQTACLPAQRRSGVQGVVESINGPSLANLELGQLTVQDKDATLRIGTHELVGKLVKLPKPLLVTAARQGGADKSIEIMGVVRSKYLFKVGAPWPCRGCTLVSPSAHIRRGQRRCTDRVAGLANQAFLSAVMATMKRAAPSADPSQPFVSPWQPPASWSGARTLQRPASSALAN